MEEKAKGKKLSSLIKRLSKKRRIVLFDDHNFEAQKQWNLSPMRIIIMSFTFMILFIALCYIVIAYTPIKTTIPGYLSMGDLRTFHENQVRIDQMESFVSATELYNKNKKNILEGNIEVDTSNVETVTNSFQEKILKYEISPEDSQLRKEVEEMEKYSLVYTEKEAGQVGFNNSSIRNMFFFTPIEGKLINAFQPLNRHYGVDIVADENAPVKACLEGTVLFSDWTTKTGYVIVIQHKNNVISAYKHNAALLKKQGDLVRAGDPIAIYGNSGSLTTGHHLHFELWNNGVPMDPTDYIRFK